MILGTGIDIIEVERVKKASDKAPFIKRVFTEREREYFAKMNSDLTVAGFFAAKEAVAKALGTGFEGVGLQDIEIIHDDLGKPMVNLYGGALKRMQLLGAKTMHVSISNIKTHAVAQAILED